MILFQTCVKSYKSNTFYFFDLHVEGAFMSTKLVQVVAWLLNDILWFWNGKFVWSNHNDPSFSNVQEQHISGWNIQCHSWIGASIAIESQHGCLCQKPSHYLLHINMSIIWWNWTTNHWILLNSNNIYVLKSMIIY
jgi:hypothetical protein